MYSTENESLYSEPGYPDIAVDGFGNVYVCFLYETTNPSIATVPVLKRGSYSETSSVGIEWQADKFINDTTYTAAEYCNIAVFNTSGASGGANVALTWEEYNGSSVNGSSRLITSADGGENFGVAAAIGYSVYDIAFDETGKIHIAAVDIEGCMDTGYYGIRYLTYSGGVLTDKGNVNGGTCMAGNEQKPQIAVSGGGETAYLVWQDARDLDSSSVADTYVAIVNSSGTTEVKLRSGACASSVCLGGNDVDIIIDRLDKPVITWNEFTADGWPESTTNVLMKTHIAVLDTQNNQPAYTLVATTSDFNLDEDLFFSKNSAIADYANNYHVFFRDQQAMRYVMMRTADGETTTPIVPTDEAIGNNGFTSAATDMSGRNYVVWMAGSGFRSTAYITVGTSSQLLE